MPGILRRLIVLVVFVPLLVGIIPMVFVAGAIWVATGTTWDEVMDGYMNWVTEDLPEWASGKS